MVICLICLHAVWRSQPLKLSAINRRITDQILIFFCLLSWCYTKWFLTIVCTATGCLTNHISCNLICIVNRRWKSASVTSALYDNLCSLGFLQILKVFYRLLIRKVLFFLCCFGISTSTLSISETNISYFCILDYILTYILVKTFVNMCICTWPNLFFYVLDLIYFSKDFFQHCNCLSRFLLYLIMIT